MDPQQRILLEMCHETLAAGKVQSVELQHKELDHYSDTGVYVGISYSEYAHAVASAIPGVSTYTATGGSLSVAAGKRPANSAPSTKS
jgi:acyl transferase domain-containing protein